MINFNKPQNYYLGARKEHPTIPEKRYLFYDIFLDYSGRIVFLSHYYPDWKIDFDKIEIFYGDKKLPINFVRHLKEGQDYSDDAFGMVIGKTDILDKDIDSISINVVYETISKSFVLHRDIGCDEVVVSTVFRNDTYLLKMWLDYHIKIGVDKFYVYFNGPVESYLEHGELVDKGKITDLIVHNKNTPGLNILDEYIESGKVVLTEWNYSGGISINWSEVDESVFDREWWNSNSRSHQDHTMTHALWKLKGRVKWIGYFDLDEYIVLPRYVKNVKECLFLDGSVYQLHECRSILKGFEKPEDFGKNNGINDLLGNDISISSEFLEDEEKWLFGYGGAKKCWVNPNNNYIMEAHAPKYPIGIGTSFYDGNKISWGISPLKIPRESPKNILIHEMYYFHMIQFTKNRELPKEWELEVFDIFKKMPRIDWRDK